MIPTAKVSGVKSDLGRITNRLGWRYVAVAPLAAGLAALALAVPAAIIDNPLFTRMTPVEPEQYVFWVATSLLGGALVATYLLPELRQGIATVGVGSGLLGLFAVGCPICNKLVVSLIGVSGALNYFAPVQPLIGLAAVGLSAWALGIRLHALADPSCPLPRASA